MIVFNCTEFENLIKYGKAAIGFEDMDATKSICRFFTEIYGSIVRQEDNSEHTEVLINV